MTRSTPERLYQLRSKQNDLAGSRQMLDKALEIPLAAFDLAWFFQRYDACAARVEMLHESLDRAPPCLPRRVPRTAGSTADGHPLAMLGARAVRSAGEIFAARSPCAASGICKDSRRCASLGLVRRWWSAVRLPRALSRSP